MTNNGLSVVSQLIASIIYLILLPFGDFFGRHLSLYLAFNIGFIHGGSSGTLGAILYFRNKLYVLGVLISIFLFLVLVLTIFHIILTVQVYRLFKSRNFTICPRLNHTGATVSPDVRRAARLT
ncbi:685_t:CDS:2 [Funneliformis mosseae]|uniref:685_t:CDS:1 n=1 Tax=Funneliformis mosseae TaxID=27381 RepID=A0A9N9FIX0_FUNMO|nr:685_t:CDS:2 [Funneliformis mosseae]